MEENSQSTQSNAKSGKFFTSLSSKDSDTKNPDEQNTKSHEEKIQDKPKETKKNGKRILVAEDEKPLSKVMFLKLTSLGYTVSQAFNGEEVLEFIKKESFDLILLDIVMPKLDGFEVLQELKNQNFKTPIIVMSNLSQAEDITKVKALGAVDFLIKSDTPISAIVEKVNTILKA